MTTEFIAYAVFGGLMLFALKKFPLTAKLDEKIFKECIFCFGFWVYLFLSFFFRIDVEFIPPYPLLSNFLLALGVSFLVWLIVIGWKALFQITYIE